MRYRIVFLSLVVFLAIVTLDCCLFALGPAEDAPSVQTAPAIGQAGSASQSAGSQPIKDAKGTYTLQNSTRLVVLDVVVKDAKGNVVTDLKPEDFKVTEASQPQTILSFEPAGAHTIDPSITIHSTAELDKLTPDAPVNILLLDELSTDYEGMSQGRSWLKKYLATQPDKLAVPTMLAAVDMKHLKVLKDYSQDKQAILSALDQYFPAYPWHLWEGQAKWSRSERTDVAFQTVLRIAEAAAGHPGHKNLIWIGSGFPSHSKGDFAMPKRYEMDAMDKWVQLGASVLRDTRVTMNTVDPGGLRMGCPDGLSPPVATGVLEEMFCASPEFNHLARATGGDAMFGYNDVDAQIATTVRDGTSFYTLTYRPTTGSLDPAKFRKIVVTLNRPGLTATTSEGYYVQPVSERDRRANFSAPITAKQLEKILNSALSSAMVYDAAPLTVTASPSMPDSFVAKVDPLGLVWASETETERYEDVMLMASTYDAHGKELNRVEKSVRVSVLANAAGAETERGLSVPVELKRDPKAVRARFVVLVGQTGRMGSADVTLR